MSASNTQRPLPSQLRSVAMRLAAAFMSTVTVLLAASAAASALGTPGMQAPRNRAVVQSLPAFEWGSVRGAAGYEFEFSAARNFSSTVNGFAVGQQPDRDHEYRAQQRPDDPQRRLLLGACGRWNARDVPGR